MYGLTFLAGTSLPKVIEASDYCSHPLYLLPYLLVPLILSFGLSGV